MGFQDGIMSGFVAFGGTQPDGWFTSKRPSKDSLLPAEAGRYGFTPHKPGECPVLLRNLST